mmetsp:Transcript_7933/g.9435  ORF Transcript_7933/g.9435 Transcript_7933/m.9435 type:complete len:225 (+) Transcript_7933:230-904(+)
MNSKVSNTAHICTTKQSVVSILSPFFSPRILDHPVINTVLGTITNNKDSMIQCGRVASTILSWVRNATSQCVLTSSITTSNTMDVVVHANSIEGNTKRTILHKSNLHQILIFCAHGNQLVTFDSSNVFVLNVSVENFFITSWGWIIFSICVLATCIPSTDTFVLIVFICYHTTNITNVLHSTEWPTTIASIISWITSNQLLFRKSHEFPGFKEMNTCNVLGSGE